MKWPAAFTLGQLGIMLVLFGIAFAVYAALITSAVIPDREYEPDTIFQVKIDCPEDTVVVWTGDAHDACMPVDDLILTDAESVIRFLQREGLLE